MKCKLTLSAVILIHLITLSPLSCYANLIESDLASITEFFELASPESDATKIDMIIKNHIEQQMNRLNNTDVFQEISNHFSKNHEYQSGLDYFKRVQNMAPCHNALEGEIYYHLGKFYNLLNYRTKAESALHKSLSLIDNSKYSYRIYMQLLLFCTESNNFKFKKNEDYLLKAIQFAEEHDASDDELYTIHNSGILIHTKNRDINKIDYHSLKCNFYANRSGKHDLKQKSQLSQVNVYMSTGRFLKGKEHLKKIKITEKSTNSFRSNYYFLKGLVSFNDDMKSSIESFRHSVEKQKNVKTTTLGMNYSWLGYALQKDCQLDEAAKQTSKAIKLYSESPGLFDDLLCENYRQLADIYDLKGDLHKAFEANQKAVSHPSSRIEYKIFNNNQTIYLYGELLKEDYTQDKLHALFTFMDQTHELMLNYNFKRHFVDEDYSRDMPIRYFYESALDVLHFLYEYTKSPLLEKRIINYTSDFHSLVYNNNKIKFDPFKGISEESRQHEKSLKKHINVLKKEMFECHLLYDESLANSNISFVDSLEILKKEYKDYMLANIPNKDKLLTNWEISNTIIPKIQLQLKPEEAIITYYGTSEHLYSAVIEKNDIRFFRKDISTDIRNTITNYIKSITKPDLIDSISFKKNKDLIVESGFKLYEFLLEKELKSLTLNTKRLTIIADDLIHSLPFKSLLTEVPPKNATFKTFPYVINKYSIAYEYSLQSLLDHKEKKRSVRKHTYVGIAPEYDIPEINQADSLYVNSLKDNPNYSDFVTRGAFVNLPSAKRSVIDIAEKFKNGVAITGRNLSKNILQSYRESADIVHFAMHAVIDPINPDLSSFVFSGQDKELNLFAYNLNELNLDTELAMLSACDTGKGENQSGRSLQSISQAFSLGGASSITMSFYKIPDEHTAFIDRYFINYIIKGYPLDEALRQSNLDYLENHNEKYSHPFYWAGIVLAGKTDPIIQQNNSLFSNIKY